MFELPVPIVKYNKQYKRNFTFTHSNLNGDLVDENGIVHNKLALTEAKEDVRPEITKAGLI